MSAVVVFSMVAAGVVWLAGRRDAARDPRLSVVCLCLLAWLPLVWWMVPKLPVLPVAATAGVVAEVPGWPWLAVLGSVWAAGVTVFLVRLALAAWGLAWWWARSVPVGREGRVDIRSLAGLRGPVAAGVVRKAVFVPEGWAQVPEGTRRMVLAHELAHHRRQDPLWRWVAELACAVNWFNPLVWWMARRLALQCECACDAAVLRGGVAVRDYARVLCDFAEARSLRGPVLAMAEQAGLEGRVRRMARPVAGLPAGWVVVGIAAAVTTAAALAMLGPQAREAAPVTPPAEVFTPQEVEKRWSANPFPGEG